MNEKLKQTQTILNSLFFHEPYYLESVFASFASGSHLLLEGFRGSGKTHILECLLKTIDPKIASIQQGYLSSDFEDIWARPSIPALMKGEEEIKWKQMVMARVKGFDEIQRMGPSALSAMFRVLTTGTVQYMDQEMGVIPFWVISTANPTEMSTDVLNIALPEPLFDRFGGCLWVSIAPLKYQIKINGKVDKAKKAIKPIWLERDILKMWSECEAVKISSELDYILTLTNRILGFCKWAQDYDASSLDEAKKRELCSKCGTQYLCSQIARPASVRAKLALERLSRGFAYVRGAKEVELADVEKAFPLVYWRRLTLMNEDEVADRLKELRDLFGKVRSEILEVKDAIKMVDQLKKAYDHESYRRVKEFVNSKAWFVEVVSDLEDYYKEVERKLKLKSGEAKANKDLVTLAKIHRLAQGQFPPDTAKRFEFKPPEGEKIEVKITPANLAKLATLDKHLFDHARSAQKAGNKAIYLSGEEAVKYLLGK